MQIEACFSPDILPRYQLSGKIVVVIDVLRATSCMVTALAHGVAGIVPVETVEGCLLWRQKGFLAAAERDGKKVEGFDLDNSPFSYMDEALKGKTIAVTTTNGTRAIEAARSTAHAVWIGAFLNKKALVAALQAQGRDVVLLCAGWKGRVNLEDTLLAGALVDALPQARLADDAAWIAMELYRRHRQDKLAAIAHCSHVERLKRLGVEKDIVFCMQESIYDVVPVLNGDRLSLHPVMYSTNPNHTISNSC